MNKIKLLSVLAIGLLISNLLLLLFIIMHNPNRPREGGPKNIISEKLHFDELQKSEYEKLITSHRKKIRDTEQQIMILKNQLYSTIAKNTDKAVKDSLISELGKAQMQIEQIHYQHFGDIKKLCKENQQEAFLNLSQEIASLFGQPHPRK